MLRRSTADTQTSPHHRVSPRVAAFRKQNIFNFSRAAIAAASDARAKKLSLAGAAPLLATTIYTVSATFRQYNTAHSSAGDTPVYAWCALTPRKQQQRAEACVLIC